MSRLIKMIAEFTGYEYDQVISIAVRSPGFYKMYEINKKNGGKRLIFHPSKETKILQYAIIEILLKHLPVHENAYAYKRGLSSPLKKNALQHAKNNYLLHIDFKDFFPSIVPEDLWRAIRQYDKELYFDAWDKTIIDKSLFLSHNHKVFLSIGAPASPIISNIVMKEIDEQIFSICKRSDANSAYTRYADDLYISTNIKGKCNEIYDQIANLVELTNSPRLTINTQKTKYTSKKGKRLVTGLCITNEGRVVIPKITKEHIKEKLYQIKKGKEFDEKEIERIKGMLAFIKDIEPDYYNKMVIKYSDNITRI